MSHILHFLLDVININPNIGGVDFESELALVSG